MVLMRYELRDGSWTEIVFIRVRGKGQVPFPSENARLVKNEGTDLSKTHLREAIGRKRYDKLGGEC
jgi:hypothetical protein